MQRSELAGAVMLVANADEGRIDLDEKVETYLPEFRGQRVAASQSDDAAPIVGDVVVGADNGTVPGEPEQPITVRMLLSRTSGLPFRSSIEVPTLDRFPFAARVRSYAGEPLQFQSATAYQSSNAGINTAAGIIEVVSGMLFEDFLQERLFGPLGMQETTFWRCLLDQLLLRPLKRPDPDLACAACGLPWQWRGEPVGVSFGSAKGFWAVVSAATPCGRL